jgi:hypothetical protein
MASILRKPGRDGQFQSLNLSTRRGALHFAPNLDPFVDRD